MEVEFEKIKQNQNYIKKLDYKISSMTNSEAKTLFLNLIQYTKENHLTEAYPWAVLYLAHVYIDDVECEKADELLQEVYDIFYENNDINGTLSAVVGFISTECMKKEYRKAIEWGIKGIKLAEESHNVERLIAIKGNIATIYMDLEEYAKAADLMEQIDEMPWVGSLTNKAVVILNRIICERKLKHYDKVKQYLDKSKTLVKNIPSFLLSWKVEYANLSIAEGQYEEAEKILQECMEKAEEMGEFELKKESVLSLVSIYLSYKEYDKVVDCLTKIEEDFKRMEARIALKELYFHLNIAYKQLRDYEKAYYSLEQYVEIDKEIKAEQSDAAIAMLDTQREQMNEKSYKLLYEQTKLLSNVGKKITANLNKQSIFKIIAEQIKNFIAYDVIQIAVYDEKKDEYRYQLVIEEDTIIPYDDFTIRKESFSYYSIIHKEDILVNDVDKERYMYIKDIEKFTNTRNERRSRWKNKQRSNSLIIVPMIIEDKVIGVLSIQSYKTNAYDIKDLVTLKTLSTYIAIALENSLLYKKVNYNANYDMLTDIYNRRKSINKIENLWNHLSEGGDDFYIAMIDIDNFKSINDNYGHASGDKVLIEVANVIKKSIKTDDIVGRYGGEEFIVVVKDLDGDYKTTIESIRRNIESLNIVDEQNRLIHVTASIGVEKLRSDVKSLEENIALADKALYEAKNTGKNKVKFNEVQQKIQV